MPHPCVVCGRARMNPNNTEEDYNFFGFPVNDEPRCKKWLEFCCREELYKLTKKQLLQRIICSKHFLQSDFSFDRLKGCAVPTIYDPKQSLYNISCAVCGRFRKSPSDQNNDDEITFHHFPGEEFRCLDWLDFVGNISYYRLTRKEISYCYICSKHFRKNQFMPGYRNRLIDGAVPEIKDLDLQNIENKEQTPPDSPSLEMKLFSSCENDSENNSENLFSTAVLESKACAACGRLRDDPKNKTQKIKFHPFPAYEIGRCLKWCQFLEREDILTMSPNQIRKLVLCSQHFQEDQNFKDDLGSGPCDAIPTIKNYDNSDNKSIFATMKAKNSRISVSSKKPKIDQDSKPKPLGKKRGKYKKSITVNVPKIETKTDNRIFKLPISTVNNWKIMSNQFQPVTLTKNIVVNNTPNVNNLILPFTGDLSNLGPPITIDSLSSIPPGLLFKLSLPESNKEIKVQNDQHVKDESKIKSSLQQSNTVFSSDYVDNVPGGDIHDELLQFSENSNAMENNVVKFIQEVCTDDLKQDAQDIILDDDKDSEFINKLIKKKPKKMSKRCRKTLLPIENELGRFITRLKPHINRLPKTSKTKVKLAIVKKVYKLL